MTEIIHLNFRLNLSAGESFRYFTSNALLGKWLAVEAEVEPRAGGKYELFWDPEDRENDSTIGCRVLVCQAPKLLVFEWKGARQFKDFMNKPPLTTVSVFFTEKDDLTDIHLLHTGWRIGAEWDQARQWFEAAWKGAADKLVSIAGLPAQ
ncbi:MAG: SRPBCC domain-containing protein [FCB group bacterium]|nr:SRPBCC domain-containing protein [FCB group bacterium]